MNNGDYSFQCCNCHILNILRVVLSNCSMDFIYNLYLYVIILCFMILPFFNDDRWRYSKSVLLLFMFGLESF